MTESTRRRLLAAVISILALVAAACGGGDGDGGEAGATIQGDTIVVDEDQLAAAREQLEAEEEGEEPEIASASETDVDALTDDGEGEEGEDEEGIEVAEAEEDELDTMLNAVAAFNLCLEDAGFEFIGAPGQDGAAPDEFEDDYLQALGACATETNIVASLQAFGAAQANRTPEEIAATNFGLPVFKECLEDLGWTVGELIPDAQGALNFGGGGPGGGLQPPEGTDALNLDDIQTCRLEAEQYVEENYEAEDGSADG